MCRWQINTIWLRLSASTGAILLGISPRVRPYEKENCDKFVTRARNYAIDTPETLNLSSTEGSGRKAWIRVEGRCGKWEVTSLIVSDSLPVWITRALLRD